MKKEIEKSCNKGKGKIKRDIENYLIILIIDYKSHSNLRCIYIYILNRNN